MIYVYIIIAMFPIAELINLIDLHAKAKRKAIRDLNKVDIHK